jgi:SAM-dependent methyltransferase
MMATVFTTAVEAWDKRWTTAEGRADWLDPDPEVMALLPELMGRGARTALDLGCGVGRHALFLAEHGLAVQAIDGSAAGLAVARETAQARGVSLDLRQGTADTLPFDDGTMTTATRCNDVRQGPPRHPSPGGCGYPDPARLYHDYALAPAEGEAPEPDDSGLGHCRADHSERLDRDRAIGIDEVRAVEIDRIDVVARHKLLQVDNL